MAGTLTVETRNKLLTSLNLKTIKLHSSDPGTAGDQGLIAGATADFSAKLGAATGGAIATTSSVEIDVAVTAGTVVVSHYSLWDNAATPVLLATGSLSASQNYTATGKYIVNTLTVDLNK